MIWDHSFVECRHWGTLVRTVWDFSVWFLTTACESAVISNSLIKKKTMRKKKFMQQHQEKIIEIDSGSACYL